MDCETRERPVVATKYGPVRGVREENGVAAFRGVPYAAPPVGALRFAAPRPHPGWEGTYDAARPGPSVPQNPSRLEAVMGARVPDWDEEGCLNLNVWAPPGDPVRRPVLVWFHGGGFTSGSGGWDWYDGGRLAALGDIVVVTANYRLGPLGYLWLPGIGAENAGCLDQGAVLRWVRDNIEAFGGDPGRVTVGGQSAGAFSALHLAVDPATAPLVHQVVAESGPWDLAPQEPAEADGAAADFLRILGVEGDADPGAALRARPVEELLAGYARLMAERAGGVAPPMYPVLGGPGVPRAAMAAVADGALDGKGVLLGSTEDEMTAFFAFNPAVQALGREEVLASLGDDAEARYASYAARRPGATPARVLTDAVTDRVFGDGVREIAARCAAGDHPAYVYRFARRPSVDEAGLGATHCAELPFLFGTLDAFAVAPMLGPVDDGDRELAAAFGGAVAAFVSAGDPSAHGLSSWPPYLAGSDPFVRRF
ncbi:carboxylesterase/lipase family protein [Streptantibioticus cattleyicolor]